MGKAGKYGYSSTRVKAMEAKLLDRSTMQNIANAADVSTVLSILFQTDYKKEITDYGGMEIKTDLIDFALSKNLAEHVNKLYIIAPGEDRGIIRAIIAKWDLFNIKMALRAKERKLGFDSIARYIVDYGQYNALAIKDVMREATVEGMINRFMVNSPYRVILSIAYDVYQKHKSMSETVAAIDKSYYEGLSRSVMRLSHVDITAASVIKMEIDMVNILALIRAKSRDRKFQEIENEIVEGGRMKKGDLSRIYGAAQNLDTLIQQVKVFNLEEPLSIYKKNKQLLAFEISMKNSIFESSMRLLKHAMLSFGTLIAYLYLKEIEVYSLRILINSRYYGLSKEEVSKLIIWKP